MNALENSPVDALVIEPKNDTPSVYFISRYQEDLPEHLIEQLVQLTNLEADTQLRHFTSDASRFASKDAVRIWLQKGRTIYTLTEPKRQNLYGILWFGREPMPETENTNGLDSREYPFTYAKRLYREVRGIGISHVFTKEAFRNFMCTSQYKDQMGKGFWIVTSADNKGVLAIDQKFGFRVVSGPNADNKLTLVASFFDIMDRIFTYIHLGGEIDSAPREIPHLQR